MSDCRHCSRDITQYEIRYDDFEVLRDGNGDEVGYRPFCGDAIADVELVEGYGYRFPGSSDFGGVEASRADAAAALIRYYYGEKATVDVRGERFSQLRRREAKELRRIRDDER